MFRTITTLAALLSAAPAFAADEKPAPQEQEAKLIAVLKSEAPLKEKADACRGLALVGTRDAVAPLAALLGDEKLSHMARYGLEPIPDPAVDDALRAALGELKGRPLVGVIGSVGFRRDPKAVEALTRLLKDTDPDVAQAAARALGRIGTPAAAEVLEGALGAAPDANKPAIYEGLFRCAEALSAHGQKDQARTIYQRLERAEAHQVREGASLGEKRLHER